jgi:hypothetical protein
MIALCDHECIAKVFLTLLFNKHRISEEVQNIITSHNRARQAKRVCASI